MAKRKAAKVEKLHWIETADELPDEGITVFLFSPDATEPAWPGYFDGMSADGYVWCTADGSTIENVTHWAEWPAGPESRVANG